jgi:hypothetical protein
MKWTKYYKFVLIIGSWVKIVDCFEFFLGVYSTELLDLAHFWGA